MFFIKKADIKIKKESKKESDSMKVQNIQLTKNGGQREYDISKCYYNYSRIKRGDKSKKIDIDIEMVKTKATFKLD